MIEQFETMRMRKDGSTFDTSITLAPVFDEVGKLITIASVGRDITERKRSERRIAQMAAIVEVSRGAIYTVDTDGRIINWNHGAELIYGYSADEVIGKQIDIIVPHDKSSEPLQIMAKVINRMRVDQFETIRQKKDGSRIDVSLTISPVFNAEGKIMSIATICQDVTERKRSEEGPHHRQKRAWRRNIYKNSFPEDNDAVRQVTKSNAHKTRVCSDTGVIFPGTKIVFMLGYIDEPIPQDGLSGPLIREPFTLSLLASKMRKVLEQSQDAK